MQIALVNDWVVDLGGAEHLLKVVHEIYPDAPLYTLFYDKRSVAQIGFDPAQVFASRLQERRCIQTGYRRYLPWFPYTIEQFDLSDYEVLLSLSHCVAKGALARADQMHICYCHTPARYAWDLTHSYLLENGLEKGLRSKLARMFLHYIRLWDSQSSNRVDHFIANSQHTAQRIWRAYRREARVIYPPIDLSVFQPGAAKQDYYLFVSRLVPYKKAGLVIEAFNQLGLPLKVVGEGPEYQKCQRMAGKNIEMLGYRHGPELAALMGGARALVFAAEEDFGMVALEAQACGTPVIALGRGGATETVVTAEGSDWDQATGIFFYEQSITAVKFAVEQFQQCEARFNQQAIINHAQGFSQERFKQEMQEYIHEQYQHFHSKERGR